MEDKLREFAKRLKLLRTERQWSQQELADKLGTSKSLISFYESCEREPGFTTILKLSEIFGESASYIMGETDERRN